MVETPSELKLKESVGKMGKRKRLHNLKHAKLNWVHLLKNNCNIPNTCALFKRVWLRSTVYPTPVHLRSDDSEFSRQCGLAASRGSRLNDCANHQCDWFLTAPMTSAIFFFDVWRQLNRLEIENNRDWSVPVPRVSRGRLTRLVIKISSGQLNLPTP